MPVHQIAVAPAGEGKSSPRSKDQSERAKAPGRSRGRSSSVTKAKGSTAGTGVASKTSGPQDSSGPPARPEESGIANSQSGGSKPPRQVTVTTASQSTQTKKKEVKRRHRRKKEVCGALGCVEAPGDGQRAPGQQAGSDPITGEEEEGRREEVPPGPRPRGRPSDSTSEDEGVRREARSWSRKRARRGRGRSGDQPAGPGVGQGGEPLGDKGAALELQSMGSSNEEGVGGKDDGGRQKRCRGGGSRGRGSAGSPSRGSSLAEEEGQILPQGSYAEMGSGGGDDGVPTATKRCGVNGAQTVCSEDSDAEVCRICHCEGEEGSPLITPCWCMGSLRFVHQACLNQWIKSSDTRCCELCKYDFIMETQLKPLSKWERLHMTKGEWRKILCSVVFHLLALACVSWSVYVLIKRTMEDFRLGKEDELWRLALMKYYTLEGVVEWPFWTKLTVVGMGVTSGLIFMYIQCTVYLQLWRRLKAFNRIITVQNCPEKGLHPPQDQGPPVQSTGDTVEIPVPPESVPGEQTDSDQSVEAAVAPV